MHIEDVEALGRAYLAVADRNVVAVHAGQLRDALAVDRGSGSHVSWMVEARGLTVRQHSTDSTVAYVDACVVLDDADGSVVCFYTRSRSDWVLPWDGSEDSIEWIAERVGWSIRASSVRQVKGSLPPILGALWGKHGVHPGLAGQIVVRPRQVSFRSEPVRPWLNEALWLVEVRGTVTRQQWGSYKSGAVGFVDPKNPDNCSLAFLD
jgi:hypothetical protein